MSSFNLDLIGFRSTIKRTSPRYRSDGLTQRERHELLMIRKEGNAVYEHLRDMLFIRDGICRQLRSNSNTHLSDRLAIINRNVEVYEQYYSMLLSKCMTAVAIIR
jgi:hypothetical protein